MKPKANVTLTSNLLRLKIPDIVLYQYVLTINPEPKKQALLHLYDLLIKQHSLPPLIYDGLSLIISTQKFDNQRLEVKLPRTTIEFQISFKNAYDLSELNKFINLYANKKAETDVVSKEFPGHIQCLEAVMKYHQLQTFNCTQKQVFNNDARSKNLLSQGVEVYTGLTHSLKLCQLGLMYNVDLCYGVFFHETDLVEFVKLYLSRTRRNPGPRRDFDRQGGPRRDDRRPGGGRDFDRRDDRGGYNSRFDRRGGDDSHPERPHGPRFERRGGLSSSDTSNTPGDSDFKNLIQSKLSDVGESNYISDSDCTETSHVSDLDLVERIQREGGDYNRGNRGPPRDGPRRDNYGPRRDNDNYNQGRDNSNRGEEESVYDLLGRDPQSTFREIASLLRKVKVETTHLPERSISFFCDDISAETAAQIKFQTEEGEQSVADYFAKKYKPLKHPNLPCVVRRRKGRDDCFFPLEVLKIAPFQRSKKKLTEEQTSQMIKIAAQPPIPRFDALKKKIVDLNVTDNPVLRKMGISLSSEFTQVKGRVLKAPVLEYAKQDAPKSYTVIDPMRGSWNLRGVAAIKPVRIDNWAVAYIPASREITEHSIRGAMGGLKNTAQNFGIQMGEPTHIICLDRPDTFSDFLKRQKPQLVIVILKDKKFDPYKEIKWRAEADGMGCVTQCLASSNFGKLRDVSFCANLLLKINVKLRGKNWRLKEKLLKVPTMLFGADVTHPGMGDIVSPSIIAVTASMDQDLGNFSTSLRVQERRKEIIVSMEEIVLEKINKFRKLNNCTPHSIIFFRDGVGESQFIDVYEQEIKAIESAFEKATTKDDKKIKLTYIIVQKRHSIKLMSDDQRTGNPTPGTVCDEIGTMKAYDFFLVSHHAMQGTAKPVRYHILYDQNNLGCEYIQNFVHNLCYLYPRATKAVSVVPPIYFAHLAAARAKCYLEDDNQKFRDVHPSLMDQLYYM